MAAEATTTTTPGGEGEEGGEECCVCLTVPPMGDCFALPCTHTLCGACVREVAAKRGKCPLCDAPFALDDARPVIDAAGSLDLFVFDTSTSMWWSDGVVPLFGWSRLHVAQALAERLLTERRAEHAAAGRPYSVCVSRFDSDWVLLLNPTRVATDADERLVQRAFSGLAAEGRHTAFFHSYLRLCRYLEAAPRFRPLRIALYMFSDGQDNLGSGDAAAVPETLRSMERKLHVVQYLVNIGGDVPRTRKVADLIHAEFFDATSYNFEEKAHAIALAMAPIKVPALSTSNSVKAAAPTSPQVAAPQQTPSAVHAVASALERLPPTPSHLPAQQQQQPQQRTTEPQQMTW